MTVNSFDADKEEPMQEPIEPTPAPDIAPDTISVEEKPVSRRERVGRSMRRGIRWLFGFLVVFALGALAVVLALYLPAQDKARQSEAAFKEAQGKVSALETQVAELEALDTQNQDLQAENDQTELHIHILSARADILAAQFALAEKDPARARVALSKTPKTLENLANLIEPDQRKVVTAIQDRLKLATSELDDNAFAAQSDLKVLLNSLLELENAYFAGP